MKCPCGVDHWHWVAAGLQGVVAMMSALHMGKVPPTEAALNKLKEQIARLQEQVANIERDFPQRD